MVRIKKITKKEIDNKLKALKLICISDYQEIKRKYELIDDEGYKYFALDIRNYSVIEMIQLFFPHIAEIPSYVITSSEDTDRYLAAQDLINSNKYTNIEIAKKLNVSVQSIYYWNRKGKINLQYK